MEPIIQSPFQLFHNFFDEDFTNFFIPVTEIEKLGNILDDAKSQNDSKILPHSFTFTKRYWRSKNEYSRKNLLQSKYWSKHSIQRSSIQLFFDELYIYEMKTYGKLIEYKYLLNYLNAEIWPSKMMNAYMSSKKPKKIFVLADKTAIYRDNNNATNKYGVMLHRMEITHDIHYKSIRKWRDEYEQKRN